MHVPIAGPSPFKWSVHEKTDEHGSQAMEPAAGLWISPPIPMEKNTSMTNTVPEMENEWGNTSMKSTTSSRKSTSSSRKSPVSNTPSKKRRIVQDVEPVLQSSPMLDLDDNQASSFGEYNPSLPMSDLEDDNEPLIAQEDHSSPMSLDDDDDNEPMADHSSPMSLDINEPMAAQIDQSSPMSLNDNDDNESLSGGHQENVSDDEGNEPTVGDPAHSSPMSLDDDDDNEPMGIGHTWGAATPCKTPTRRLSLESPFSVPPVSPIRRSSAGSANGRTPTTTPTRQRYRSPSLNSPTSSRRSSFSVHYHGEEDLDETFQSTDMESMNNTTMLSMFSADSDDEGIVAQHTEADHPTEDDGAPRRSKRRRYKPLKWYKGEHMVYERRQSGVIPTVTGVERVGTKTPTPRYVITLSCKKEKDLRIK